MCCNGNLSQRIPTTGLYLAPISAIFDVITEQGITSEGVLKVTGCRQSVTDSSIVYKLCPHTLEKCHEPEMVDLALL